MSTYDHPPSYFQRAIFYVDNAPLHADTREELEALIAEEKSIADENE